jgi:acetyl-CoA carboxylase carboxyltransferase component
VFRAIVRLRHVVPQIAVITGTSAGGGAYAPALMDWTVMVKGSTMFLTGPSVVKEAVGEDVDMEALGGYRIHARSGVADLVADDERHATTLVHDLLAFLPQTAGAPVPSSQPSSPLRSRDPSDFVPTLPHKVYDVRDVIKALADDSWLFELCSKCATSIHTGLFRLEGRVLGVIANQPRSRGGVLDVHAARKAARFVNACNAYGIPILVLVDTAGFMPGVGQETRGIIDAGADLIRAFASATVPRLTVVLRKAYGGAYITMNSKDLGADFAFAWPKAEIGVMAARSAALILESKKEHADAGARAEAIAEKTAEYMEDNITAMAAAERGLVDEVIEPNETRARLGWALTMIGNWRGEDS